MPRKPKVAGTDSAKAFDPFMYLRGGRQPASCLPAEIGRSNTVAQTWFLAFAALGITSQVSCSASIQPREVGAQEPGEVPTVASTPTHGTPAPVGPPPPERRAVAAAPTWESDARYAKCVREHETRAARDSCYVQMKRASESTPETAAARTESAAGESPTTPPEGREQSSTIAVVDPDHPQGRASDGWRVAHRAGPTRQIEVVYESAAALSAALRQRMELEMQPAGEIRSALRRIAVGGELTVSFTSSSHDGANPEHWLVVLEAGKRVMKRHRGDWRNRGAAAGSYYGFVVVPVPRFAPPLDIYVVPPAGNFRIEYRLDAAKPER